MFPKMWIGQIHIMIGEEGTQAKLFENNGFMWRTSHSKMYTDMGIVGMKKIN